MSNPFSTPENLDPEAGFTHNPSIGQAANDLRVAAGERAREFVHAAETKASELKERALGSAHQIRETAAEKAHALKTAAAEKAQQFKETAACQWDDTRVKAREFQVTAEDYIRQHPAKCVLCALGAGFLLGLIARR